MLLLQKLAFMCCKSQNEMVLLYGWGKKSVSAWIIETALYDKRVKNSFIYQR